MLESARLFPSRVIPEHGVHCIRLSTMKFLFVAVPDSVDLPPIEGSLLAVTDLTSAQPGIGEIQAKCRHLAEVAAQQLGLSVDRYQAVGPDEVVVSKEELQALRALRQSTQNQP